MKLYELTYLLPPNLAEEEQTKQLEKIRSLIEKRGGVLDTISPATKKNIAYPIKKRAEAVMGFMNFYLPPQKTPELSAELKDEEGILRHLLYVKEGKEPRKKLRVRRPKISAEGTHATKLGRPQLDEHRPAKKPKIEMEKLDEKIEELLGE